MPPQEGQFIRRMRMEATRHSIIQANWSANHTTDDWATNSCADASD